MKNKIITIFGATGFIGQYVVGELAKSGYTIRVITRSFERAKNLRTGAFVGQIVPVIGDLRQTDSFPKLIEGSYAVVNLVGLLFETKKQKFNDIHNHAAEKLAATAKKLGVQKFIHISAIVPEESAADYAKTKILGESAVQIAFPDAVILKPSVVFGAEDNFINKFAKLRCISPFLPLIGGGNTKFQPVYVADIAKAVAVAINEPKTGTFQLVGPQTLTFKEILQKIAQYTNRKARFINIPFFAAKIMGFFASIPTKITQIFGLPVFKPAITADQVELLKHDNVASGKSKGFKELGINPTAIDAIIPQYLSRYKKP